MQRADTARLAAAARGRGRAPDLISCGKDARPGRPGAPASAAPLAPCAVPTAHASARTRGMMTITVACPPAPALSACTTRCGASQADWNPAAPRGTPAGCAGTRRRLTALLARLQRPRRSSQGRVVLGLRCSDRRTERSCCGKKRERGDTLTDPKDPFWITMMDDVTFTRVNVANSWPFCTFLYRIVPCCGRSRFHPKKTHAQFSAWVREQDRFLKPPTVCAGQALKPGVQSLTA